MPYIKWISWLDEETGYISNKRKSPKKGNPYEAFYQLYKIKSYLNNPNLRIKIIMMNMEEIRLLNGWSDNKKKGSTRFDRFPIELVSELDFCEIDDYMQMIPIELNDVFTSKEYAKEAHISVSMAQIALNILTYLGIVKRVGKKGNSILYEVYCN
jgi:ribosomal protein S25